MSGRHEPTFTSAMHKVSKEMTAVSKKLTSDETFRFIKDKAQVSPNAQARPSPLPSIPSHALRESVRGAHGVRQRARRHPFRELTMTAVAGRPRVKQPREGVCQGHLARPRTPQGEARADHSGDGQPPPDKLDRAPQHPLWPPPREGRNGAAHILPHSPPPTPSSAPRAAPHTCRLQVVLKTLMVIHRMLRDCDPSAKVAHRILPHVSEFQMARFMDDTSHESKLASLPHAPLPSLTPPPLPSCSRSFPGSPSFPVVTFTLFSHPIPSL